MEMRKMNQFINVSVNQGVIFPLEFIAVRK